MYALFFKYKYIFKEFHFEFSLMRTFTFYPQKFGRSDSILYSSGLQLNLSNKPCDKLRLMGESICFEINEVSSGYM